MPSSSLSQRDNSDPFCAISNGEADPDLLGSAHSAEEGTAVEHSKVYDDICVAPGEQVCVTTIIAHFVTNSAFGPGGADARMELYTDCSGCPGRLIVTAENTNNGDNNPNPGPMPREIVHSFGEFTSHCPGSPVVSVPFGCEPCDGDANFDGVVDVNDISYVLFRLGGGGMDGDANVDGSIDVNDISYVLLRFGGAASGCCRG